jgi:hypothetical protein
MKSVFISHRNDPTGKAFAGRLKDRLVAKGYDVFMDDDGLLSGLFAPQLLHQIGQRDHFVLAVTPNSLEGCRLKNDWVRREYEEAVRTNRNIVPVFEESVKIPPSEKTCPKSMKGLFDLEILSISHSSYDAGIDKLISNFLIHSTSTPVGTLVLTSGTRSPQSSVDWEHYFELMRPFVSIFLAALFIASLLFTLYQGVMGNGWNPYLVPVTLGVQFMFNCVGLPEDILIINLAGAALIMIGSVLLLAVLAKSHAGDTGVPIWLALLGTGCCSSGGGIFLALQATKRYTKVI